MTELEIWQARAMVLWDLLDWIDTAEDMAKGNDVLYRDLVRFYHNERWKYATSDGYDLTWKDLP